MFPILDIETTGLIENPGAILEISVIMVNKDLEEVDHYSSVIHYDLNDITPLMNDWCIKTHTASNLLLEVKESTKSLAQVEQEVIQFIKKHIPNEKPVLTGNSIHFDRRFLKHHMPMLESLLHYRMIDISSFGEFLRLRHGIEKKGKEAAHRGLSDTRRSLEQLRTVDSMIKVPNSSK